MNKHLKILTGGNGIYNSITDRLKEGIQVSDILTMTKDNIENIKGRLALKPFFSSKYYLEVYPRGMDRKELSDCYQLLTLGYVQVVFICTTVREYEMVDKDNKFEMIHYNGYNPDLSVLKDYIRLRYSGNLEDSFVRDIKNRLRGHYNLLDSYIQEMNLKLPIDLKALRKIVPKLSRIGMWAAYKEIIMGTNKSNKRVLELCRDFQNGGKFLINKMQEYYDLTMELYEDFYDGKLTRLTVKEYIHVNKELLEELKLRERNVEDLLDIYENTSYEKLILFGKFISDAKKSYDKNIGALNMYHKMLNVDKLKYAQ